MNRSIGSSTTDHNVVTNLFPPAVSADYNPIGTHTWHSSFSRRSSSIFSLVSSRSVATTPDREILAKWKGEWTKDSGERWINKRDRQNTPTGLPSKLVVSSPETKRSLYTLPSRGRRLSPKTLASSAETVTRGKNFNSFLHPLIYIVGHESGEKVARVDSLKISFAHGHAERTILRSDSPAIVFYPFNLVDNTLSAVYRM